MSKDSRRRRRIGELADEIEREMQRVHAWDPNPPSEESILAGGAFGLQAGPFEHWVQVVLVARLREVAAGTLELPGSSMVGTQATREWNGQPDLDVLTRLLIEVDEVTEGRA